MHAKEIFMESDYVKKNPLDNFNRKGSKVNNSLNKKLVIDLVITNQLSRYYELVIPYIKRLFNVLYMVIPLFRVSHISYYELASYLAMMRASVGFIYIVALKVFFKNTYIQFPNEVYISKVCNLHYNNYTRLLDPSPPLSLSSRL